MGRALRGRASLGGRVPGAGGGSVKKPGGLDGHRDWGPGGYHKDTRPVEYQGPRVKNLQ